MHFKAKQSECPLIAHCLLAFLGFTDAKYLRAFIVFINCNTLVYCGEVGALSEGDIRNKFCFLSVIAVCVWQSSHCFILSSNRIYRYSRLKSHVARDFRVLLNITAQRSEKLTKWAAYFEVSLQLRPFPSDSLEARPNAENEISLQLISDSGTDCPHWGLSRVS